jgi:glycosyltransferase involved in cell wall biosynthesis
MPKNCGPLHYDAIFIVDSLFPRLGMARAVDDLMSELSTRANILIVTIAGPQSQSSSVSYRSLDKSRGILGRLRALRDIRALARKSQAPLVAVGTWAALTTIFATFGVQAQIVLWEHTLISWRIRNERAITIAAALLRLVSWKLRYIVAVSPATARAAAWLVPGGCPIKVITNVTARGYGKNGTPARPLMRSSDIQLLGLGSLTRLKNWSLAIQALTYLPDNYGLIVAGEGPDRSRLERLASDLHVRHRVRLPGYVESTKELLQSADIVVHPSLAETFGYVLMEAAESERPVVVQDRPAMNEYVPDLVCGVIAPSSEPSRFAEAIQLALLRDHDFTGAAKRRNAKLDAQNAVKGWLTVFRDVSARSPAVDLARHVRRRG